MRLLFVVTACALMSASSAVMAGEKKDSRADPDKVICKAYTPVGSRIARKSICMTRKEWQELSEHSQDYYNGAAEDSRRVMLPDL